VIGTSLLRNTLLNELLPLEELSLENCHLYNQWSTDWKGQLLWNCVIFHDNIYYNEKNNMLKYRKDRGFVFVIYNKNENIKTIWHSGFSQGTQIIYMEEFPEILHQPFLK
jgi:hypothetical protein